MAYLNEIIIKLCIGGYFDWLPDKIYLKIFFRSRLGYKLNLKHPKTFNEKIQWLKLYDRNPLYSKLSDKHEVRDFVARTIGAKYLVPLIGIWESIDDIDFSKLPQKFVLKCTHDSQSVVICQDKSNLDIDNARKFLERRLSRNYYYGGREYQYKHIVPRIVAEQYLEDSNGQLKDYKFFCFNGEAKILFVASNRMMGNTKFDFFDMKFNRLQLKQHYPNSEELIERPLNFDKMRELAETLTKNFTHCRVDFYDVNGKIYFGELTFTHFCGFESFEPIEWDYILGSWIKIPL